MMTTMNERMRGAGISMACLMGLACGPGSNEPDERERMAMMKEVDELGLESSGGTAGDESGDDSTTDADSTTGYDPTTGWTSYDPTTGWTSYDPTTG